MKCIALTGIFPQVIDELKKGIPRTVELTSAHNIISLTQVEPGSQIFLTMVDCEDVAVGDAVGEAVGEAGVGEDVGLGVVDVWA